MKYTCLLAVPRCDLSRAQHTRETTTTTATTFGKPSARDVAAIYAVTSRRPRSPRLAARGDGRDDGRDARVNHSTRAHRVSAVCVTTRMFYNCIEIVRFEPLAPGPNSENMRVRHSETPRIHILRRLCPAAFIVKGNKPVPFRLSIGSRTHWLPPRSWPADLAEK